MHSHHKVLPISLTIGSWETWLMKTLTWIINFNGQYLCFDLSHFPCKLIEIRICRDVFLISYSFFCTCNTAILAVRPCPYICTRSDIKISWHSIRRFLSKGKEAQTFVEWFTGENIGIIGLRRHSHVISSSILHLMIWWNIIYSWRCFLVTIENKTVPSGTEKEVHSCWNLCSFIYCSQISMYEIRQNKLIFYWCRISKNINELFNPKVSH